MTVAALYVQQKSVYSSFPNVELYDLARDARTYGGPWPVVAHPPCRSWGKFKAWAKPVEGERELAFLALEQVQRFGGVLEHPVGSTLFAEAGISASKLWRVNQCDWGHRALKPTWLYLVGCNPPADLPQPGVPVTTVERMCRQERERTPPAFAGMLLALAASARR
ncbi:MAG: hypothetical protein QUV71_07510 [Rhizobium sp.]|nr:hypothetical protein [Rhizobium sp.]MDM8015798.1 hypothetical protein [Rhizobium sp.]